MASQPAPVLGLGRPCIDFVFTGGEGGRSRWETWHEPADVARWFAASALAVEGVAFDRRTFAAARDLREALWLVVRALAQGKAVPAPAVAAVNAAAAAPPLVPVHDLATGRTAWHRPNARQCLASVARDAVALLGDERQRSRVRECANPNCSIVFLDDSRPGTRRWCRPDRCGDRLRAQAYRARVRASAGRPGGRRAATGARTPSPATPPTPR